MRFSKILCPIDFSPTSKHALRVAVELATKTGAQLMISHVWYVPAYSYAEAAYPVELVGRTREDAEHAVDAAIAEARSWGATDVTTRVWEGPPWRTIVDHLEVDPAIELVVLGATGRSALSRVVLGSVAEQVVRHAPCSVIAVHAAQSIGPVRSILCPVDLSEAASSAVDLAASLVTPGGRGLTLLHVLDLPVNYGGEPAESDLLRDLDARGAAYLERLVQATRKKTQATVTGRTRLGSPGRQILAVLDGEPGFDLVVMSSHGRTGLRRILLGSVAEKVLRYAPCSVLIARDRTKAA